MIITLKSADFSKNNINDLLNTFSVSYSGTGVTGTPRSIAKENGVATESLSATITIASNYTYESLTVRVGGNTLTAGTDYTVSGTGPVTLSIPAAKITGNVVVSVQTSGAGGDIVDPEEPTGTVRATSHTNARAIPTGSTSTTNLFDTIGYIGKIWDNNNNRYITPSDTTDSLSIPVVPGDKIVWTAVKQSGSNGGSSNGIRYTLFSGDAKVNSIAPADAYAEYSANGYITIPDGVDCINMPVWDDGYNNECFLLTLSAEDTSYIGITPIVGTRTTTNSHANVETMPSTITSTTNLIGTIPQTNDYYYLASGWGAAAGLACITFPVLPGDKISGNVLGTKTENGSSVNGTRVTYLSGDTIVTSTPPTTIYNEYVTNGHITVPSGCDCMCIPFNPSAVSTHNLNIYLLTI